MGTYQAGALQRAHTGLIWAQGELIVELDDCCIWMSPDWLEKHVAWHVKGFAVSGSWTINGWEDGRCERYAQPTRIGPNYSTPRTDPIPSGRRSRLMAMRNSSMANRDRATLF